MRVLDVNDVEVETPNLERGYLKEERLFIAHHEAVEAVEEEGHWETVVEYPNGGRDVNWVADVPAVEAEEAWDEYEDILRYVLYGEEELAEIKAQKKLQEEDAARLDRAKEIAFDAVTWADLETALLEGVNSI